jgi:hypothetical protein
MKYLSRQFKQILLIIHLLFFTGAVLAQTQTGKDTREFKTFSKIATRAGVGFNLPDGFSELPVRTESKAYDYGMAIPGQDFEIWFKITPQTNAAPDSLYLEIGKTQAKQLAGDNTILIRNMSTRVLAEYNADAGKTYFVSLPDTRHYKYALLITLEKNHKSIITALCLTNDKGPDFFQNINRARNCIKFKEGA